MHLPALRRLCLRDRTWLGESAQIDTTSCPDIARTTSRAARLTRHHTPEQILLAETASRETITRWLREDRHPALTRRWAARARVLSPSQSSFGPGPPAQNDLMAAATYRETITLTAALLSSPTSATVISEREADKLSALLIDSS